MGGKKLLFNEKEVYHTLLRLTHEILERIPDWSDLAVIGIKEGGAYLANRLVELIEREAKTSLPIGYLDITLYRDDIAMRDDKPVVHSTEINFDVTKKTILLVDEVIFTGRTIRAALDAIMDLGRPKAIKLVALIDRGKRELPIAPDFTGKVVPAAAPRKIRVEFGKTVGKDKVYITQE